MAVRWSDVGKVSKESAQMMKRPLDYSQLSDEEVQEELEKGYRDIQEGKCAYVDEVFKRIRTNIGGDLVGTYGEYKVEQIRNECLVKVIENTVLNLHVTLKEACAAQNLTLEEYKAMKEGLED